MMKGGVLITDDEDTRLLRRGVTDRCDCSPIIGVSPAVREICRFVSKASQTKSPVLIVGESGTGKELIARSLHSNSPRRDRPLITVNCGAIPPSLLESELFGHTKGAFTDAVREKKGLFEEADGGSLFLDEVADLSLDMQVKLLRAIENGQIRRIGDNRVIQTDVRIIAALNRNLEEEVQRGAFRRDLYYRLNVLRIHVPPLRERPEDTPVLARHFLEKYSRIYGRPVRAISPEAMEALMAQRWSGNVRELEHTIERAVVMGEREVLTPADFSFDRETDGIGPRVVIPAGWTRLKDTIEEVVRTAEQELIRRVLEEARGNRTKASQMLGISRRSLLYKLKAYRIGV